AAGRGRRPRARDGAPDVRGHRALGELVRAQPAVRRPATPRDRARPRHPAAPAPARRARRRLHAAGEGRAHAPGRQDPRVRGDGIPDRARHEGGDGHQQAHRRARPRRDDRLGHARAGAHGCPRYRGVSRKAALMTTAVATKTVLELSGVDAFYGRVQALHGVSLTVGTSEIVALIGSNGAGKTTTLRTISGLMHPAAGSITFAGQDITRTA